MKSSPDTGLVFDALEGALAARKSDQDRLTHHSDGGAQGGSKYSERLEDAKIGASVGSDGRSHENALVETVNGLYKSEVIEHEGPWSGKKGVAMATLNRVHWSAEKRLFAPPGYIAPAAAERNFCNAHGAAKIAADRQTLTSFVKPCRFNKLYMEFPFALCRSMGSRMLQGLLVQEGFRVGRLHVATLMNRMGIEVLCRKSNASKTTPGHKIYRSPLPSNHWRITGTAAEEAARHPARSGSGDADVDFGGLAVWRSGSLAAMRSPIAFRHRILASVRLRAC